MEVYRCLASGRLSPAEAALISPPAVAYTGIIDAIQRREWFVTIVAANTIIANFTPILLANVPFNPSQTYTTHLVCAWTTVAFLAMMILTLMYGAVFIGHPKMTMDPSTLVGRVYQLYDLGLLDDGQEKRDVDEMALDAGGKGYSLWKAASFFGEEKARVIWGRKNNVARGEDGSQ